MMCWWPLKRKSNRKILRPTSPPAAVHHFSESLGFGQQAPECRPAETSPALHSNLHNSGLARGGVALPGSGRGPGGLPALITRHNRPHARSSPVICLRPLTSPWHPVPRRSPGRIPLWGQQRGVSLSPKSEKSHTYRGRRTSLSVSASPLISGIASLSEHTRSPNTPENQHHKRLNMSDKTNLTPQAQRAEVDDSIGPAPPPTTGRVDPDEEVSCTHSCFTSLCPGCISSDQSRLPRTPLARPSTSTRPPTSVSSGPSTAAS
jgi:hypothetical protein